MLVPSATVLLQLKHTERLKRKPAQRRISQRYSLLHRQAPHGPVNTCRSLAFPRVGRHLTQSTPRGIIEKARRQAWEQRLEPVPQEPVNTAVAVRAVEVIRGQSAA